MEHPVPHDPPAPPRDPSTHLSHDHNHDDDQLRTLGLGLPEHDRTRHRAGHNSGPTRADEPSGNAEPPQRPPTASRRPINRQLHQHHDRNGGSRLSASALIAAACAKAVVSARLGNTIALVRSSGRRSEDRAGSDFFFARELCLVARGMRGDGAVSRQCERADYSFPGCRCSRGRDLVGSRPRCSS